MSRGAITMLTMAITLIMMFIEGPEVSLRGSPTVSPTTQPLWVSPPLPPKCPSSTYFFALSQAPPALDIMRARRIQPREGSAQGSREGRCPVFTEAESNNNGGADREHGGQDHALGGGLGRDVHAAVGIRFPGSFEQARNLTELSSNFRDHVEGGTPDGIHGDRAVEEGDHSSDEDADEKGAQDAGIAEVEVDPGLLDEGGW